MDYKALKELFLQKRTGEQLCNPEYFSLQGPSKKNVIIHRLKIIYFRFFNFIDIMMSKRKYSKLPKKKNTQNKMGNSCRF